MSAAELFTDFHAKLAFSPLLFVNKGSNYQKGENIRVNLYAIVLAPFAHGTNDLLVMRL